MRAHVTVIDIFIHHKMIAEKKIQSKNKENILNFVHCEITAPCV